MSNGNTVMRVPMWQRPRYCSKCGADRNVLGEGAFIQTHVGQVVDWYSQPNSVYQLSCVVCGNVAKTRYNVPGVTADAVPPDWVDSGDGSGGGGGDGTGNVPTPPIYLPPEGVATPPLLIPPSLTGMTPASAKKNSKDTTITLTGADFSSDALVEAEENVIASDWIDAGTMTAVIPRAMLTVQGPIMIRVYNPEATSGYSSALSFTVI